MNKSELVEVEIPAGHIFHMNGIPVWATEGTKVMCHQGNLKLIFEKPVYSEPSSGSSSFGSCSQSITVIKGRDGE